MREYVEIEADRTGRYVERYPICPRVRYYPDRPFFPQIVNDVPDPDERPATSIPHPLFRDRPPVREFVPGLGDSFRTIGRPGKTAKRRS